MEIFCRRCEGNAFRILPEENVILVRGGTAPRSNRANLRRTARARARKDHRRQPPRHPRRPRSRVAVKAQRRQRLALSFAP
jgi:hypothetical protein